MSDRIYLGEIKQEIEPSQSYNPDKDDLYILGEKIYMDKHSWDCNWYFGFGYIGNRRLHTHADVFIHELIWHEKDKVFNESIFKSNDDFWIFKDLLKQAYILKDCAEIYQIGGHCITHRKTEIIKNKRKAKTINKDLEKLLDHIWNFLLELQNKKEK